MANDVLPLSQPAGSAAARIAEPGRDVRIGAIIAFAFFGIFLGWAAFARLDAAAYAQGTVTVSGQRQSVQHRDGGVVGEILVREGQRVSQGALLIRLSAADVRAQERALTSQATRLLAQRARLETEQLGQAHVVAPQEFAALSPEDQPAARLALRLQQTELDARTSVLAAQRQALQQRVAQSGQQGRGYNEQAISAREQLRLINEQLAALKPVADRGFVSQTRMRELERTRAELQGQRGQYAASVAQTSSAARENEIQVLEAERSFRERTAAELREVDTALGETLPKLTAARDQLKRTEIRAPATGAIVGLSIFTPGGVIAPGQKLMDIIPEKAPLVVQVRIAPDDADDLNVGRPAFVKFPGLHERTIPNLTGILSRLSADSLVDEKTGQSFFTGEVTVGRDQLALLRTVRGQAFSLRAGMPAQVLVPLRKRTALDYAVEPLIGSFWSSFREH